MANAVFFWNSACPQLMCSPRRFPMTRPITNCKKQSKSDSAAMSSNNATEAPLCTMFFTVMPDVMVSEKAQQ